MKKIVFITGTRSDFSHQKVLIDSCIDCGKYDIFLFVTGTHLDNKYGFTMRDIKKCNYNNVFQYRNYKDNDPMDVMFSKTVLGFSKYIRNINPDMVVVFADRIEQLGAAIVGVINNVLTVQIEAGDISGTIDESIRHSITKLCHAHFVANQKAYNRLIQMGEKKKNIFIIGSPSIDTLLSLDFSRFQCIKNKYKIPFMNYSILVFHPVATEYNYICGHIQNILQAIIESELNYIVIGPNNDLGSEYIWQEYEKIFQSDKIRFFSSLPFKDYLVLLKNADFIIGNSSSVIIEAPYLRTPTINIGTRQQNRTINKEIIECNYKKQAILEAIKKALTSKVSFSGEFGTGNASKLFIDVLNSSSFWNIKKQKKFIELKTF